jgi:hypothetical protein
MKIHYPTPSAQARKVAIRRWGFSRRSKRLSKHGGSPFMASEGGFPQRHHEAHRRIWLYSATRSPRAGAPDFAPDLIGLQQHGIAACLLAHTPHGPVQVEGTLKNAAVTAWYTPAIG